MVATKKCAKFDYFKRPSLFLVLLFTVITDLEQLKKELEGKVHVQRKRSTQKTTF